nr:MAG TPA: hypothetical protein [Caudoviricetes sp.]
MVAAFVIFIIDLFHHSNLCSKPKSIFRET